MFCHRCGVEVQPKQRFCGDCGVSLIGVTDPTEELIRPSPAHAADPLISASFTDQLPVTQAVTGVVPSVAHSRRRGGPKQVYDFASDEPDDITHPTVRPAPPIPPSPPRPPVVVTAEQVTAKYAAPAPTGPKTLQMPLIDPHDMGRLRRFRFRFGVVSGTAVVAALVAVVGVFANVTAISTDATSPTFDTGDWLVGDLGSNLQVAGLVGIAALLVGAVGAGFGIRWGAGLAGGAGLALAGWAALVIGLAEQPLQAATTAVEQPTTESFTITLTRDLGYWLLLATIVLGGAAFVVSLVLAGNDGRSGLNPWIAALGAVSALIAAGVRSYPRERRRSATTGAQPAVRSISRPPTSPVDSHRSSSLRSQASWVSCRCAGGDWASRSAGCCRRCGWPSPRCSSWAIRRSGRRSPTPVMPMATCTR